MDEITTSPHYIHFKNHVCSIKCISWTAIIIGTIVGVSIGFLLDLLALAIGLTSFPTGPSGQTSFAIGGFIGLVIFAIVAMFPAGWIAGFLGRTFCLRRKIGELYGLVVWGLTIIVAIVLSAHIGQFLMQSNSIINQNVASIRLTEGANPANYIPQNMPQTPPPTMGINPNAAAVSAGVATFIVCFMFFIGLIASCIGGHFGITYRKNKVINSEFCPHCQ